MTLVTAMLFCLATVVVTSAFASASVPAFVSTEESKYRNHTIAIIDNSDACCSKDDYKENAHSSPGSYPPLPLPPNELIRLHELDSVVDTFVILESRTTVSGLAKPLYFQQEFLSFSPSNPSSSSLVSASSRIAPFAHKEVDWIIVLDLNEMPRRAVLRAIHHAESQNPQDRICYTGVMLR
ncbi:MAG: hypothetical protein JOS17DRAFT_791434 [Linnemannia elongata]|nr:MAG: hypothetical protein JOS17DRAFT_791434 [Linnemannia elongata]